MGVRGDTRLLHRKRARPAEVTVILGDHSWRARAYRASGTALAATQIPPAKHSSSCLTLAYGDRALAGKVSQVPSCSPCPCLLLVPTELPRGSATEFLLLGGSCGGTR